MGLCSCKSKIESNDIQNDSNSEEYSPINILPHFLTEEISNKYINSVDNKDIKYVISC